MPKRIEFAGGIEYRLDGILHRVNGPAIMMNNGNWYWGVHDILHRYYGPVCNMDNEWWVNGDRIR